MSAGMEKADTNGFLPSIQRLVMLDLDSSATEKSTENARRCVVR
jgi:hypothetical protein